MNKLHFQNSGCICESARIYVFVCLSQNCAGSCHHRFTLQNVYTVSIIKTAFQEAKLHLHNMKVKKAKLHQTSVLLLFSNSNCSTKIYLWAVLWNIFLFPYPLFFSNTSYIYIYIYIYHCSATDAYNQSFIISGQQSLSNCFKSDECFSDGWPASLYRILRLKNRFRFKKKNSRA